MGVGWVEMVNKSKLSFWDVENVPKFDGGCTTMNRLKITECILEMDEFYDL